VIVLLGLVGITLPVILLEGSTDTIQLDRALEDLPTDWTEETVVDSSLKTIHFISHG